ncbi:hypothetical protein GCM10007103_35440 [Salinimicrobium marinum]|uniref:Uncharacterized protein n=2 Tax=Salinimicrobium marinum TaxID=680283 RepID=A0A918W1Z9_9FLAO|nr:hypothetical protein GCM10007103_35440 [Salinimicrobium marinum]
MAQSNDNLLDNFARINLGLHGIEGSYELPVSKKFVWENSLGIGMGANVNASSAEFNLDFGNLTPFLKSELKYVYNINKRESKGKNIVNNSGNYIGLQTKYSFGNSKAYHLNSTSLTEVHWGLQRSLGGNYVFDFHIGLGYLNDYNTNEGAVSPTLGLRFGYKLF